MTKSILKTILICLIAIIFFELICRLYYSTLNTKKYNYKLDFCLNDSSIIDIKNHEFRNLKLKLDENDDFSFYQTINKDGCRITYSNEERKNYKNKPKIIFTGCSFTEGDKVNDTSVFAYLLQNKSNNYEIINAAKGGFGATMALKKIHYLTEKYNNVEYVFYNYVSFHKARDYKNYSWISNMLKAKIELTLIKNDSIISSTKNIRNGYFIFSELNSNNKPYQITYHPSKAYIKLLDISKLFLFLNTSYSYYELKAKEKRITKIHDSLILEMNDYCKKNGINFILANMSTDNESNRVKDLCVKNNIRYFDYGIDFDSPKYSYNPIDCHPNNIGHSLMADKLLSFLNW